MFKLVAAPPFTVTDELVPVIDASVAVMVCVPAVFNVVLMVAAPEARFAEPTAPSKDAVKVILSADAPTLVATDEAEEAW